MSRADLALALAHGPLELLPVSSSAHVELLAGRAKELDVALHAGAALALRPWPAPGFAALTVAPPAAAGGLLERPIEERLGKAWTVAAGLLAGAVALAWADRVPGRRGAGDAGAADALALGAAQALALWPGVSRTGATLVAARARGFCAPAAWALSRAAAAPVLAAAGTLKAVRVAQRRPARGELVRLGGVAAVSALSTAVVLGSSPVFERVPWSVWSAYRAGLAVVVLRHNRRR